MTVRRRLVPLSIVVLAAVAALSTAADFDDFDDVLEPEVESPNADKICAQVRALLGISNMGAQLRSLAELPPLVLARCALQSPTVRGLASHLPQAQLAPLLDANLSGEALGSAIRLVHRNASRTSSASALRRGLRQLAPADAIALYERVADSALDAAEKSLLLGLLTSFRFATVFVPIVVNGAVLPPRESSAEALELRHEIPWHLQNLLECHDVGDAWKARMKRFLEQAAASLPPLITQTVAEIVADDDAFAAATTAPLEGALIARVRSLYPAPFDRVFPYADRVAERLFERLRAQETLVNGDAVEGLARLGLRFTQVAFLDLDVLYAERGLFCDRLLPLARHERGHLFHRLVPDPFRLRGPRQLPPVHGTATPAQPSLEAPPARLGDLAFVERVQYDLVAVLGVPAYSAYLRRHPDQVQALVTSLMERGLDLLVEQVAEQAFMASAELATVADALLRQLCGRGGAFVETVRHLCLLPHLDLYASNPSGPAPLARIAAVGGARRALYEERILRDHEFLNRIERDANSGATLTPDGRALLKELKRRAEVRSWPEGYTNRYGMEGCLFAW